MPQVKSQIEWADKRPRAKLDPVFWNLVDLVSNFIETILNEVKLRWVIHFVEDHLPGFELSNLKLRK